ncbi:PTS ascorbate transporter subunit IIC [Sporolactobacillus terrae]|uniref:PTS ascorbate transporter subunit IIC n=1 Tax=Sporolactobacillus terrae TaxID=269673 RepID=UPI001117EE38|nr:PTS ascorbate transporter subunit IIC [Sporolactobacillus terrae]
MINFIISLFSNAGIILGIVALVGLLAQKKSGTEVFTGTAKTIIGFLIFSVGATTITGSLQNFNTLFTNGFHVSGIFASPEAATALAQNEYGTVVSLTLIFGFVMNIVFARITPLKNIFFTGQHLLYFACVLALILKFYGLTDWITILLGGAILGLCSAGLPQICQPFMRKLTGSDKQAIGHFNMVGYALAGTLGMLFRKYQKESAENIKFPKWLSFFKDFLVSVAVIMLILFYVATLKAGPEATAKIAGTTNWLVFPLIQSFTFTAGMAILLQGVRMFLAEITAAFVAISEKLIPGSRPALDVPTVFPYAPMAVILGFLVSYGAGLLGMVLMIFFGSSVVIIPAAHIAFFSGGTAGIFGNATGGWRGAVLGSFVIGLMLSILPALLYPLFGDMGISGTTFPNIDYNIIGSLLNSLLSLFK